MRRLMTYLTVFGTATALIVLTATAQQPDKGGKGPLNPTADSGTGAIGDPPKKDDEAGQVALHLTDAQRQKIRAAVADDKTDITFKDDATKEDKDFTPSLGATIPAKLPMQVIPSSLAKELPMLGNFGYIKMKGQVLIVNPRSKKIVDVFPVTEG
jgi:hypothetical protein